MQTAELEERVRLRLHWGGNFQSTSSPNDWKYVGGEVFNESVPAAYSYFDLCLKLNEKVGYTTSIKYQAPGEDLSPNELVSITGDDDLQELYDEYFQALRRKGTPVKTFRVKIYLFPALQLELDTEAGSLDVQQGGLQFDPLDIRRELVFDPDEWCAPSDDEEFLAGSDSFARHAEEGGTAGLPWTDHVPSQKLSTETWHHHQLHQQQHYQELPPGVMPAFLDTPSGHVPGAFGAAKHIAMNQFDRHVLGNLMQSISVARQHSKGISDNIDYFDPYHEQEYEGGYAIGGTVNVAVQQKQEVDVEGHNQVLGYQWGAKWRTPFGGEAEVQLVDQGDNVELAANADENNRYSSLVGKLPSRISIFGDGVDCGNGGMALSGEGGAVIGEDPAMVSGEEEYGRDLEGQFKLPSHISAWNGSNCRGVAKSISQTELSELSGGGNRSKCITQEFARDGIPKLPNVLVDEGNDMCCESASVTTPKLLDEVVKVPVSEVRIIRKIGEGAFGEVSFASVESHGHVAIKWLKRDRFAKYSESFMREAEVLAKLNHPNIIRMYGVVVEPVERGFAGSTFVDNGLSGGTGMLDQHCIIAGIMTDYVRGGSLSGQLRALNRPPTLKERCQVAVQAARGMAFLHAQNPAVIHFDLKPDNLLVDGDGETLHVKVADFGLSKHKFQTFVSCRDLRGTLPYMAPELVSNPNQVSERCDVWSMGVVMWEMYTLEVPYREMTAQQILMALLHGNIHLHVPSSCEPEWRGLIEMCMDPNPDARPSFKQLTTHLDALLRQLN